MTWVQAAEAILTNSIAVQWMLGVAAFAAAVKGLIFLVRSGWRGFNKTREVLSALAVIGSKEAWPNGSTSLPDAMSEIYRRQSETYAQAAKNAAIVQAHLDKHDGHLWEMEKGTDERNDE